MTGVLGWGVVARKGSEGTLETEETAEPDPDPLEEEREVLRRLFPILARSLFSLRESLSRSGLLDCGCGCGCCAGKDLLLPPWTSVSTMSVGGRGCVFFFFC